MRWCGGDADVQGLGEGGGCSCMDPLSRPMIYALQGGRVFKYRYTRERGGGGMGAGGGRERKSRARNGHMYVIQI